MNGQGLAPCNTVNEGHGQSDYALPLISLGSISLYLRTLLYLLEAFSVSQDSLISLGSFLCISGLLYLLEAFSVSQDSLTSLGSIISIAGLSMLMLPFAHGPRFS